MQKNSTLPVYKLTFLIKNRRVFEGEVSTLTAPGSEGYLEILANHAPIIALLKEGKFSFVDDGDQPHEYKIKGGILEFFQNSAIVLADDLL